MPIGIIINVATVFFGGIFGGILGDKLSDKFKTDVNLVFGACSMAKEFMPLPL